MAVSLLMPRIGPEMTEGRITGWFKVEGERVEKGEPVVSIEAEKATVDLEAPVTGVLDSILKPEGTFALVGEILGKLISMDEVDIPNSSSPTLNEEFEDDNTQLMKYQERLQGNRQVRISPRARRLAKELSVDISQVDGSGPGGRITYEDVLSFTNVKMAKKSLDNFSPSLSSNDVEFEELATNIETENVSASNADANAVTEPFIGIRSVVAKRMQESHQITAPVTLTIEACASELVELRERLNIEFQVKMGYSISYMEILVKIISHCLEEYRYMNARLNKGLIQFLIDINIGIAVDTERGLIVPVIHNVNNKRIVDIAIELRKLVEKARTNTILPQEMIGGTFTITNLGMYEIDAFTPIINLPEVAVLGVGQIKPRPVVIDNQVRIRNTVWLSLTFDHRLVDGAPAARFLQHIKQLIEKPVVEIN